MTEVKEKKSEIITALSSLLSGWNTQKITKEVQRVEHSSQCIELVTNKYFKERDAEFDSVKSLETDVLTLQKLFPDLPKVYIRRCLKKYACHKERIQIALRKIVETRMKKMHGGLHNGVIEVVDLANDSDSDVIFNSEDDEVPRPNIYRRTKSDVAHHSRLHDIHSETSSKKRRNNNVGSSVSCSKLHNGTVQNGAKNLALVAEKTAAEVEGLVVPGKYLHTPKNSYDLSESPKTPTDAAIPLPAPTAPARRSMDMPARPLRTTSPVLEKFHKTDENVKDNKNSSHPASPSVEESETPPVVSSSTEVNRNNEVFQSQTAHSEDPQSETLKPEASQPNEVTPKEESSQSTESYTLQDYMMPDTQNTDLSPGCSPEPKSTSEVAQPASASTGPEVTSLQHSTEAQNNNSLYSVLAANTVSRVVDNKQSTIVETFTWGSNEISMPSTSSGKLNGALARDFFSRGEHRASLKLKRNGNCDDTYSYSSESENERYQPAPFKEFKRNGHCTLVKGKISEQSFRKEKKQNAEESHRACLKLKIKKKGNNHEVLPYSSDSENERYQPPPPKQFKWNDQHTLRNGESSEILFRKKKTTRGIWEQSYRESKSSYSSDSDGPSENKRKKDDAVRNYIRINILNGASTSKNLTHTTQALNFTKFNLVSYLKELVPNKSEEEIRKVCHRFRCDISIKPTGKLMDLLLNVLYDHETSEESDEEVVLDYCMKKDTNLEQQSLKTPNEFDAAAILKIQEIEDDLRLYEKQILNQPHDEGVAGPSVPSTSGATQHDVIPGPSHEDDVDNHSKPLFYAMMEMFPDACPNYLRGLCRGKTKDQKTLDDLVNVIFSEQDYPKRVVKKDLEEPETNPEAQLEILQSFLPDADPSYLQLQVEKFRGNQVGMEAFISDAIEKKNYPTMKEYLRKQKLTAQVKQYTDHFDPEKFLELIPDPETYFNDKNRKPCLETKDSFGYYYSVSVFRNHFPILPVRQINQEYTNSGYNFMKTWKALKELEKSGGEYLKKKRSVIALPSPPENIPLLQEIAYTTNKKLIEKLIMEKEKKRLQEIERCKEKGLMKTCNCCYDDEILPKNIAVCPIGHEFCKGCVEKSVEVAFGEGRLDFPCLLNCTEMFSVQTLQVVLKPNLFSKVAQKKQLEEIKAAGIEDLVMCPFCDFATIPPPGDKIFRCLNPDCMKESCIECKEPSHVPYRCDEVERDVDVKRRKHIEDKMTEALLRKCYKCGLKFIKADGCNKMTCSCGAMMCYICRQPVTDYKHFNGQGGDKPYLCPLYSDTHQLHKEEVLKGAEEAKAEIGGEQLKIDPTVDVKDHYQEMARRQPAIQNIQAADYIAIENVLMPQIRPNDHVRNVIDGLIRWQRYRRPE